MFGNILIDKIRLNVPDSMFLDKKITINTYKKILKRRLARYFSDGAFTVTHSRNEIKITLTPTRFIPASDVSFDDVNLETPTEDWLFNLLNELGCFGNENRRFIEAFRIVELHLTKNVITKQYVFDYIDCMNNRTYKRMKANIIQSNETNRTLRIATPKRNQKERSIKGDRQFILYDKAQQLKDKANIKQVVLKRNLKKEELKQIPAKNYLKRLNRLTLDGLNIARLELQYKNSSKLCKLANFIAKRDEKILRFDSLLDLLRKRELYVTLNDFYREELKEFVFIGEPENNSEELTSWDGLFTELIKEADIKNLIALYNECSTDEIHNGKNFVAQIKKFQQLKSNDLYNELFEKLGLRIAS